MQALEKAIPTISPSLRRRQTIPDLKQKLETLYRKINRPEFILNDPVQFPRRYSAQEDIEISAFLSASIAWGRRDLIIRSCRRLFNIMEMSPAAFIMSGNYEKLDKKNSIKPSGNIHRTFFEYDLKYFCRGFRLCYDRYGNLESLFVSMPNIWESIALFRETMARGNKGLYSKHIANPFSNSACKRINLALRWLVRREGPVDLGIWKRLSPAALFIPLDIHVGRTARQLGLLNRKANDKKAVLELTEKLREFCPDDPVKFDLALFGMGIK